MSTTLYILISVLAVSCVSFAGVVLLSIKESTLKKILLYLVSFSTGALFANVFVHLLPEIAEESTDLHRSFLFVLGGIILSFIIEKFIHWHHCHSLECDNHIHPVGKMVLIGDGAHNITDGILIATTYLVSVPLGIATTIAVALHEIPQEIGDFGVLVHSGYTRIQAILLNFLSAITAFLGAFLVIVLRERVGNIEMILLPLVAGNFLYIAGSDLIPELHKETRFKQALLQLFFMILGVALMFTISTNADPHGHESDIHHESDEHHAMEEEGHME